MNDLVLLSNRVITSLEEYRKKILDQIKEEYKPLRGADALDENEIEYAEAFEDGALMSVTLLEDLIEELYPE